MKIKKIASLILITAVIAVPLLSCGGNEARIRNAMEKTIDKFEALD